jgi:hypothetical protein
MDALAGREIIFEFRASSGGMRVCAIDCASGIEVFVTTPLNAAKVDQCALASRKLARSLSDQGVLPPLEAAQEKGDAPQGATPLPKRGWIV